MCAAAGRVHDRSGQRITDGLADEDFACCRESRDAGADVDCETRVVVALVLDLTEVDAASYLQTDARRFRPDFPCDGECDRGTRRDDEEVVTAGADLPRAIPIDDLAH